MDLANEPIFAFLAQFAYQPLMVYSMIVCLMVASSFGFPVPEEVTLISAGFITHMALNPETFPPPYAGAHSVEPITIAIISLSAVFLSDFLVFMLGKKLGSRFLSGKHFKKYRNSETMKKVEDFTEKYGALACGVFRFTPGLRFPGHFACGSMNIPSWKFIAVDGFAALVSVPTQVLLIAYYGEIMLQVLKEFKIIFFASIAVGVIYYFGRKFFVARKA